MPRRPPYIDPLSPHGIRLTIVRKLVAPETLAAKGGWGRELAILKRLQQRFPADRFWLQLAPAVRLESLAYFLGQYGAAQLQSEWNAWQFGEAQDKQADDSALDRASIYCMMDSGESPTLKPAKKRMNAIEWADYRAD